MNRVAILIKDVIKRNQGKINNYAKFRATKSKFNGRLKRGESQGVQCRDRNGRQKVFKSDFIIFRGSRIYLNPYSLVRRDYPFSVVKVVRKRDEKGHWYMQTSFPDWQGKL